MIYGYARVSTQEQSLNSQTDALKKAGCEAIYKEKITGAGKERPELKRLLDELQKGDTVIVWKLDRLGRSISELINLVNGFNAKGIGFISLQDSINTESPYGRFMFHLFASLAELEKDIIKERTMAGLKAARARGRKGGRPAGLSDASYKTALAAYQLHQGKKLTITEITSKLGIGVSTLYRYLKIIQEEQKKAE